MAIKHLQNNVALDKMLCLGVAYEDDRRDRVFLRPGRTQSSSHLHVGDGVRPTQCRTQSARAVPVS